MGTVVKSTGHGLLAAGVVFIAIYLLGAYLRGSDALHDALNPFVLTNYLALAPLELGILLTWFGNYAAARRQRARTTAS